MYIFQDTKIEDIPPIILQANFYLILGLAPQQKYVYMYVYYIYIWPLTTLEWTTTFQHSA